MPWVKKKVEVIYNPLSKDYYQLYEQVSNSKPVILHIGTALHKNLQNVIEAVSSLTCKLIIVGKLFPNQMKRLIENEIDFENSWDISREQLINLYKQADVVSFPSSQEGFGMIVIEANAMGKAVVAGDIPVLHEVGNNAALFVDPNDIVAIRNGFKILIENSMTRETYIKAGRINAQRFQLEAIAKKYNRVYEYLSKNKSFIN